ncbi:MAG: DUF423 domain-containing protein [Phycisphaerae bacterium]
MHARWVAMGALNGLLAVVIGAFGAHALKSQLDPGKVQMLEVGVRYQMYHALALLALGGMAPLRGTRLVSAAATCMIVGIVLFSGSLYGLSLTDWRWLGPITPVGGACLMLGWLMLVIAGSKASIAPRAAHA